MLALLRILFGFALFSVFAKAIRLSETNPWTEGTTDGGYVALAVVIGLLNAVVWAPLVGRLMADPLTGAFTSGHPGDFTNRWLQFAHKLALRRWRRAALFFAFLEGVRCPDMPGAFVLGLQHARPGSWLEKVFAREVWRFDNAENCLRAWKVLSRRGIDPGLHARVEVNLLLQSQQRVVPPPRTPMPVPVAAPAPVPRRNGAIRLFEGAPGGGIASGPGDAVGVPGAGEAGGAANAGGVPSVQELAMPGMSGAEPRGVEGATATDPGGGGALTEIERAPLGWRERWQVLWTGRLSGNRRQ